MSREQQRRVATNELLRASWRVWRPPPRVLCAEWVPAHVVIPDVCETPGPFDAAMFPHVRGVLEAVDDPMVRVIVLRWATRSAKTLTAVACLLYWAVTTGRPCAVASADEASVDDLVQNLVIPMAHRLRAGQPILLPPHRQNLKLGVRLETGLIRKAYAGSRASLAGYPACYGVVNEAGLWSPNAIRRFLQRGRLFPYDSKYILEGKPEAVGDCAISSFADSAAAQRRYFFVRCPHCGKYQRLVWGDRGKGPGVKWDDKAGATEAVATAYYRCQSGCKITDADRPGMIRAGKWIAEGQRLAKTGRVLGRPKIGPDIVVFDGISSLYSLVIPGWGALVAEFLAAKANADSLREFVTGTLAEPWDPAPRSVEPHELAERLAVDEPLGVCPEWSRFLTVGADVGRIGEELIFYWVVIAWGQYARSQLVDYGIAWSKDEMRRTCARWEYPHADGGPALRPVRIGIDSGAFTEAVYSFCRELPNCWPVKGSSTDPSRPFFAGNFIEMYRPAMQRVGVPPKLVAARIKIGQYDLIEPNTTRTQQWIEDRITGLVKRTDRDWFSVPAEVFHGQPVTGIDFAQQLCNDYLDENGHWRKRGDNEFRDALRYAVVMAWHYKNNGRDWNREMSRKPVPRRRRQRVVPRTLTTPDGRPFLATDR